MSNFRSELLGLPETLRLSSPPPRVLTYGFPGSGKTYSLRTLLSLGLEVFVIFTENSMEVLTDTPPSNLHWAYVPASSGSLDNLLDFAETVNMYTYQAMSEMKSGFGKQQHKQFITFIKTLMDFKDARTGQSFGNVNTWGPDRVLVLDSLSGLNIMAMANAVGSKPVPNPGEYRIAQETQEQLINNMTMGLKCGFILTGHPERSADELGQSTILPGACGSKLSPRLPRYFSDVVFSYKDEGKFFWSTAKANTTTKNRNLPSSELLPQSYAPIWEKWLSNLRSGAPVTGADSLVA